MPPIEEPTPNSNSDKKSEERKYDLGQAFLLFSVFAGDAVQTAHALDVSPDVVKTLAEEHKWDSRLRPIIELSASARAGDVEKSCNRALNFVTAHRLRAFLERVLKRMFELSPADLESFIFPTEVSKRDQRVYQTMTTRALADLASALEKASLMTYAALADSPAERKVQKEESSSDATAAELHCRLAKAMQLAGGGSRSIKALVAEAQLDVAQDFAAVDLLPRENKTP